MSSRLHPRGTAGTLGNPGNVHPSPREDIWIAFSVFFFLSFHVVRPLLLRPKITDAAVDGELNT